MSGINPPNVEVPLQVGVQPQQEPVPEDGPQQQEDAPQEAPQGVAPAPERPKVKFALTPGCILTGDKVIDYSDEAGRKLYKNATESLKSLHDLSAENLRDFLKLLEQRANNYDWSDILEIPIEEEEVFINLIRQYGNITLKQVRAEAETYMNTECRAAQDSRQLADCIINSLTVEARNTVTLYEEEYMVKGQVSGTCLLKVVIRESHIDTNATTRIIREELNKLDSYLVSIDSDILKFNEHVKSLMQQLEARGATTHDLLSNLFTAYRSASDKQFVAYINDKKNEYDEGKEITPALLMLHAANKFKTMKQDKEWNAPSKEEEQILALQAQVNKLRLTKANRKSQQGDDPESEKGPNKKKKKMQGVTKTET